MHSNAIWTRCPTTESPGDDGTFGKESVVTEKLATLQTAGDRATLRFERRLAHPPEKVWKAITDPAELAHWFPATVETELEVGAAIRFRFEDQPYADTHGEIVELDPPRSLAYSWDEDMLRWEIVPDDVGCRLYFTHTFGGSKVWGDRLAAPRHAAGWEGCFDLLSARLDGRATEWSMDRWFDLYEIYVEEFGAAEGELRDHPDGYEIRFERDFYQPVDEVWAALVEEEDVSSGVPPPLRATNEYVAAGPVTAVEAQRILEYRWMQDGAPEGAVRWEFVAGDYGCRVVLTQTVPSQLRDVRATALAAWHTHLELFAAAVNGKPRPWPAERTEMLKKAYADQIE
jgi:uncharacterized protein YndB with AHSA1/START domain